MHLRWEYGETLRARYFTRSAAERLALKRRILLYSVPAKPLVHLLALIGRKRSTMPAFEYAGVCGPPKLSSAEVFERAANYAPRPEDVFVATQMRSGTTWMQQLVYQIVTRGVGELDARGRGHLYAISPWIDALAGVPIDAAPLVGDKPVRIVKTHLPTALCPYAAHAKYIYVARHPVRCFARAAALRRSSGAASEAPGGGDFDALIERLCLEGDGAATALLATGESSRSYSGIALSPKD